MSTPPEPRRSNHAISTMRRNGAGHDRAGQLGAQPDSFGKAERLRQLFLTYQLLSAEQKPDDENGLPTDARPSAHHRIGTVAHSFHKAVAALLLAGLLIAIIAAILLWHTHVRLVPDYRLETKYWDHEATDAVFLPESHRVCLATDGGGIHTWDARTGFSRHHTHESTANALLSDNVIQLDRDDQGRLYLLCREEARRGLCRADGGLGQWQTLLGLEQFPELSDPRSPAQVTAVAKIDDRIWIATDRAGVGVYDPHLHRWTHIHRAAEGGLLDDRVRDLLVGQTQGNDKDGTKPLWIATAAGINRFQNGGWEAFKAPEHLAGVDVRRLFWGEGKLWYVTAGGGCGQFDGSAWRTIASEDHWENYSDADVSLAAFHPDRDEAWFVSNRGSTGRYSLAGRRWDSLPAPPGNPKFSAVAPQPGHNGAGLLAASSRGVLIWSGKSKGWSEAGLQDQQVVAIDASPYGVVAVAAPKTADQAPAVYARQADGKWSMIVGPGRAAAGPKGILAATASPDGKSLYVGTESGIATYDIGQHQWLSHQAVPRSDVRQGGGVLDLQANGRQVLALTSDRLLAAWSPSAATVTALLGGGQFPANLDAVTAVTCDGSGRLWLGTAEHGVHLYDPARRQWTTVEKAPAHITHLAAAQNGVWALAGGTAYFAGQDDRLHAIEKSPKGLNRIWASPEDQGAVALDPEGRVFHFSGPEQPRRLVGDQAADLDLRQVSSVAMAGDHLVVAGKRAFLYSVPERSWSLLSTQDGAGNLENVLEIVPVAGDLWFRTQAKKIFRLPVNHGVAIETSPSAGVVAMTATQEQIVALADDASVWVWQPDGSGWKRVKDRAQGPAADVLSGANPVVLAVAKDLYLAGGQDRQLWWFSWDQQRWQPISSQNAALKGVTQLAAGHNRVFVLAGDSGAVYSLVLGQAEAALEPVAGGSRLRGVSGNVVLTDRQGTLHCLEPGGWIARLGELGLGLPEKVVPQDAFDIAPGLLLSGPNACAVLGRDLATWKPIAGSIPMQRFLSARGGKDVWGLSSQGSLYWIDADAAGPWKWAQVQFAGANRTMASATIGGTPGTDQAWGCLDDGSVYRIQGSTGQPWFTPSAAPGRPADVVGVAPASKGFLVAFRNGALAHCAAGSLGWTEVARPTSASAIARVASQRSGNSPPVYWILDVSGSLHRGTIGDAGLQWQLVGQEVSDLATCGQTILVASDRRGTLQQWDAAGNAVSLSGGAGRPGKPQGKILAAGEVDTGGGQMALVLSDGANLYVYNPQSRSWSTQKASVVELQPLAKGVAGLTSNGEAVLIEWARDALSIQPLVRGGAVRLATTSLDDRMLVLLDDGQVVLANGTGNPQVLREPSVLPAATRQAQIVEAAGVGNRFFLALSDGSIYVYLAERRTWQQVPGVPPVRQIFPSGGSLLALTRSQNGAAADLFRIQEEAGQWKAASVAQGVSRAEGAPGGTVAIRRTSAGTETGYWSADNAPLVLNPGRPMGPDEKTVVAARSTRHGVWMRTQPGTLWHYGPTTRTWHACDLGGRAVQMALLDEGAPVVCGEGGTLFCGLSATNQSGAWTFHQRAAGVDAFDCDGDRLAFATTERLVVESLSGDAAVKKVERQLGAAWPGRKCRVAATLGIGSSLWLASDAGDVARYDLDRQLWQAQPNAPWPAARLVLAGGKMHALNAQAHLAVLEKDGWKPATASPATSWQQGELRYAVDQRGMLQLGQPPTAQKGDAGFPQADFLRLHAFEQTLWLELSNGALYQYRVTEGQLSVAVPAAATPQGQNQAVRGLVTCNKGGYFLDLPAGRLGLLKPEQQEPFWLSLPKGTPAEQVFVVEKGLLLAGKEKAVLVAGANVQELPATQWKPMAAAAKPLTADRGRDAGDWRLVPSQDSKSLRLERRVAGVWHSMAVDPETHRFAWDVALGGMFWQGRVYVQARAGIAVYKPGTIGPPEVLYPVAAPADKGLQVWAVGQEHLLLIAGDGQTWRLPAPAGGKPADLEVVSAPETVWQIEQSRSGLALKIRLNKSSGTPVAVSLDAEGQLGLNRVRALAWMEKSLLVATADAVLEFSRDLDTLKAIHPVVATGMAADPAGHRVLAKAGDQAVSFDGQRWNQESALSFDRALATRYFRESEPLPAPIRMTILLGHDKKVEAEYSGRSFLHDTPHDAGLWQGSVVTSDGKHVFIATQGGLLMEDSTRRLTAVFPIEQGAIGLAWRVIDSRDPALCVLSREGKVYQLQGDKLVPASEPWATIAGSRVTEFGGRSYRLVKSEDGRQLMFRSTDKEDNNGPTLDLAVGRFAHDRLDAIGLSPKAAWFISRQAAERIPLAPGITAATFPLSALIPPSTAGRCSFVNNRLELGLAGRKLELPDQGKPQALASEREEPGVSSLLAGRRWNVRAARDAYWVFYYRKDAGWQNVGFRPDLSFSLDAPRAVVAVGESLVLQTAVGTFLAPLPHPARPISLDEFVPLKFERDESLEIEQFWGWQQQKSVWARAGGAWHRLDLTKKQWHREGDLPAEASRDRDLLCETAEATWRRNGQILELAQKTQNGLFRSVMAETGMFDAAVAQAVWQDGTSLWLLTAAGLRQVDLNSKDLLAADGSGPFKNARGEFRFAGGQWLLFTTPVGGKSACYRLDQGAWKLVADGAKRVASKPPTSGPSFRATWNAEGRLSFEIRGGPDNNAWQPAIYLPNRRRFDFQIAQDAVLTAGHALVLTPAGLTLWNRTANGLEYAGLRNDLKDLVIIPGHSAVLALDAQGKAVEYTDQVGWAAGDISEEERRLLARSEHWRCWRQENGAATLEIRLDGHWCGAPLSLQGDFEFRRPTQIGLSDPAAGWTASDTELVKYRADANRVWTPEAIYRAQDFDGAKGKIGHLLSVERVLHLEVGTKSYALGAEGKWTSVRDDAITRSQETLWSGGGWLFQRPGGGTLLIQRQIGGVSVPLRWDANSGRFDIDTVSDAALWKNALWLATSKGVLQAATADGQPVALLPAPDTRRFALDRVNTRLLVAVNPEGASAAAVEYAEDKAKLAAPVAPEQAASLFRSAYLDKEWQFELGSQPALMWRGIRSGITGGRFTHDQFGSLTLPGADIWVSTPVALERFRLDAGQLALMNAIPSPIDTPATEILSVSEDTIRVLAGPGDIRELTLSKGPERGWQVIQSPAAPYRVLADTPFWVWKRPQPGVLAVQVKLSNVPDLTPALDSGGRFAFDEATAVLAGASANEIWVAGAGGIVRQNGTDGGIRYWYRQGAAQGGMQSFGAIVLLGRFSKNGDPVPSCAPGRFAEATLFALDDQDRAWQYDGKDPGTWRLSDTNPWAVGGYRWLIGTPSLAAALTPEGRIRLGYKNRFRLTSAAGELPPVLSQGRLLADVVRGVAFHGGKPYLQTPAGVVEVDDLGRYRRMWTDAGGERGRAPTGPAELFVHPTDGRLYYSPDDRANYVLATDGLRWQAAMDDEQFRRNGQILLQDYFWTWRRWRGAVHVQILGQEPSPHWPLFAEGRFSFDALKHFRITQDRLWGITAAGIVQFDRENMKVISIERSARDSDTGAAVLLDDAVEFARGKALTCFGTHFRYTRQPNGWVRALRGGEGATNDVTYDEPDLYWRVAPLVKETGGSFGFDLQQYDSSGALLRRFPALPGVSWSRIRRIVAAEGRLWICLDHDTYRVDQD